NTMEGCAGGANGTILRTTDGGTTWQAESSGLTFQDINDIVYVNNGYIAVASGGKIITDIASLGVAQSFVEDSPVSVFPNPAGNETTFEFENNLPRLITVHNSNGQKIITVESTEKLVLIDLKSLSVGIYSYKVQSSSDLIVIGKGTFVKQ
ncbi:MAG: T9SS type A sorting domain-containing protein, partial [Flavobacteriales bacterium]|nr:T9SS type A sorting domain-containing protein [Flavobacteriales bacterium]